MKLLFVAAFTLFLIPVAFAGNFQSGVYEIVYGLPHFVKFENGRVAFLRLNEKSLLNSLKLSMKDRSFLDVEVDDDNNLVSVQVTDHDPLPGPTGEIENKSLPYSPHVLRSYWDAQKIFGRMRKGWQYDSQCYNRAHIWANEEFRVSGLKSMKLFLFFTNRYIRNYNYKWWFHVSPMTYVKEGTKVIERVLDRRYTGGPRLTKTWTDNFIYGHRSCPQVAKYSQYYNNQEKEDCYLIKSTMFFWQPRDLGYYEQTGLQKTNFIQSEIDWAYWEAF